MSIPQSSPVKFNHIDDYLHVPTFNAVLSHGTKPLLKVPQSKISSMLALGIESQGFIVLCLPSEFRSIGWFNLIEQGKRLNLDFRGAYTCAADVLQTLLQENVHEKDVLEAAKLLEHERETITKIVQDSAPLS